MRPAPGRRRRTDIGAADTVVNLPAAGPDGVKVRGAYWLAASVWTIVTLPLGAIGGYAWHAHTYQPSAATFDTPATTAPAPARLFPGARLTWNGSGRYTVPSQAPTGTYLVAAGKGILSCQWQLLSRDDDKPKHEISSGIVNPGTMVSVTIGADAAVFVAAGDCYWGKP